MIRNFISKLYSLYTPSFFMSGGGSASGYVIERSLRCSAASSTLLRRTFGTPTDVNIWTLSLWCKRGALGSIQNIFGENAGNGWFLNFNATDNLEVRFNGVVIFTSTAVYRDPSAHMHILWSLNGTTNKIFVNGTQIGSNFTGTNGVLNSARLHGLFCFSHSNSIVDGYLSEAQFVDGQALTPSSFGEINQTTGQWVAKKYIGTYGTNGFYLDFKDGTSTTTLGQDKSGNANNWTLTNFTRSAGVDDCWMLDVPAGNGSTSAVQPSGNYCVWNILDKITTSTLAGANLQTTSAASQAVIGSIGMTAGLYYWEVSFNAATAVQRIGVYGTTTHTADITPTTNTIGLRFNRDTGALDYTVDGTNYTSIATGLTTGTYFPYVASTTNAKVIYGNFGQRSFAYTPPAGFKALCTANLPTPSIKKPSDHFKVQLSTGANIKTDSEALFTNELVWIKDRANANNHQLIDSVRGSSAVLQSNTTAAETTYTAPSGSSVGWVWRASDSAAVTNTNGSISSQVSANVAAGFSVVTYTGNGAVGTVGHGLGVAPKLIIIKKRTTGTADIWIVGNSTSGWNNFIQLELTNALAASNGPFNSTAPSSSVFTLGTSTATNQNTSNFVAYCFAEIAGYSKFGSYTGNGSADGTNVTLGFDTAFLMIKRTDTTSNWTIFDNQRDGYNVDNDQLYANTTAAEVATDLLDLTSNGFKLRSSDASINANGGTYIYMAFAETPFQYANAH